VLEEWLADRFRRHRGNCDVVRQDVLREHGITVSLRTVERAGAPLRQALRAEARACLRFETAPGRQPQIDFGAATVAIADIAVRVHLFVATLGYSRRPFVRAFRHERQSAWFDGMEGAFQRFVGVPQEVLFASRPEQLHPLTSKIASIRPRSRSRCGRSTNAA
jgi:transposase